MEKRIIQRTIFIQGIEFLEGNAQRPFYAFFYTHISEDMILSREDFLNKMMLRIHKRLGKPASKAIICNKDVLDACTESEQKQIIFLKDDFKKKFDDNPKDVAFLHAALYEID